MNQQINQDEINKAAWAVCDTFRGVVDPSIYKDYVLTMLFLKCVSDIWQEDYEKFQTEHGDEPELIKELLKTERFLLPEQANFWYLHKHRNEPGNGERIDQALHALEEENLAKLRDVFQDISFNSTRLGDEKQKNDILRHMLEDFAKESLNLRLDHIGDLDVIGNTYEYLIDRFASTAGKKAGEFYTPSKVSILISRLVDPKEGDEICDPACGSASLLMKCGKRIQQTHKGSKKYALYGQEAIGSTWALAKMNLFLHGEENHRVLWGDTLRNPKLLDSEEGLQHFDVVVANPPFSLEKWGHDTFTDHGDKYSRFRRGLPPKTKGDYAFILHMIETMKPRTGRMGVVVPHGVLFRGSTEGKIRQQLIEENLLHTVIGLPEKLFFGTGIPAAVLIFKQQKQDDKVLFIDASRDYRPDKNQNYLRDGDLDKIEQAYYGRQSIDKYAYLAGPDEIRENDYNLNIPRYVDTFEEEEEIDLVALRKEREALKTQLAGLEEQMEKYLEELGYES